MKNISKYFGAALLLLAVGCNKSQEGTIFTPAEQDSKAIHFIQSSVGKEFDKNLTTGVIDLQIARSGNVGEYTVRLEKEGANSALFTVPAEVTIPDGEFSVTIPVTVDLEDFQMGASYNTVVALFVPGYDPEEGTTASISRYKDRVTLSASFELTWETFMRDVTDEGGNVTGKTPQLATFNYSLYYTGNDVGLEVEKAVGTVAGIDIYRVKDWASGVMFRFIHNTVNNTCVVPGQSIGYFNSNYNEYVFVSDMPSYTGGAASYGQYPCSYDPATKTFSFYLIYYVTAGYFVQGTETLVFESEPDTKPVVGIEFTGIESISAGIHAPKIKFSPNEYTKSYKATVVAGDFSNASRSRLAELRERLIADDTGELPVMTLYAENEQLWSVPSAGNYSAVALPYNEDGEPEETVYVERFTYDPDGVFEPVVEMFEWKVDENEILYSPYTTLFWGLKVRNVSGMRYMCIPTATADYLTEALGMTLEELMDEMNLGYELDPELIALMSTGEGYYNYFSSSLSQGTSYTMGIKLTNAFGDTLFISKEATTWGYYSEDFDRTKTMDDYLGAFVATAIVESGSTKTTLDYRVDITRVNDIEVVISGASDIRDFAPELRAMYDEDHHSLVIGPQALGTYGAYNVALGFYDGMSIMWGGNVGIGIGYIGDKLYWRANPYANDGTYGYSFLLFDKNGAYTQESVGDKRYTFVSMEPLVLAPKTTQAGIELPVPIRMSDNALSALKKARVSAATGAAGAVSSSNGKTMRTDLRLHSR